MTKKEKIDKVYGVIADKTLDFGCYLMTQWTKKIFMYDIYVYSFDGNSKRIEDTKRYIWKSLILEPYKEIVDTYSMEKDVNYTIIWHPVMLWDVLDWIEKQGVAMYWHWVTTITNIREVTKLRKEKRREMENQPDDCIDFIYNLISKND